MENLSRRRPSVNFLILDSSATPACIYDDEVTESRVFTTGHQTGTYAWTRRKQVSDMEEDMEQDVGRFAELLSKESNKRYRRYELRQIDGRLMLVRNEIDRFFDLAMSEVFGIELEPDDKDGMFLD
jgi:hypothetical protein